MKRNGDSDFAVIPEQEEAPKDAYIGVRSCELHAISHLDDALLNVPHPDPTYAARRERMFVVALNCHQAGGTCFCVSMETGPRATFGYDVALTEVIEDRRALVPGRGRAASPARRCSRSSRPGPRATRRSRPPIARSSAPPPTRAA